MKLLTPSRLERLGARLSWPGPTHFDHLRAELFALLTTVVVIGIVAHSFWCDLVAD